MSGRLLFDKENHAYTLDGMAVIPSVTDILKRYFPYNSAIPPRVLEAASLRSVAIHEGIEEYEAMGAVPELPAEWAPYFASYLLGRKALLGQGWSIVEYEKSKWAGEEDQMPFAGTIDLGLRRGGETAVVDVKATFSAMPTHAMQIGAYCALADMAVPVGWVMYLEKTGRPAKLVPVDCRKGWQDFDTCRRMYYLQKRHGGG